MLTNADRIKADIAEAKAAIEKADWDIEQREKRLNLLRSYRDKKFRLLAQLEEHLAREEAPRAQLTGPCVIEKAHDGVWWKV